MAPGEAGDARAEGGIRGPAIDQLASGARGAVMKDMLLYFMMSRGLKKLEGEKAAIGLQANGMASLGDRRSSSNRRAVL
jgi:hypothetical protein